MLQPFDASKSLTAFEQESTVVAVIEMSQSLPPHQPGDLFCPIVHDNSVTANYFESLGIVDGLYAKSCD